MATACGVEAVRQVLMASEDTEPVLVGMRRDGVATTGLLQAVVDTRGISRNSSRKGDYQAAVEARGRGFMGMIEAHRILNGASPRRVRRRARSGSPSCTRARSPRA